MRSIIISTIALLALSLVLTNATLVWTGPAPFHIGMAGYKQITLSVSGLGYAPDGTVYVKVCGISALNIVTTDINPYTITCNIPPVYSDPSPDRFCDIDWLFEFLPHTFNGHNFSSTVKYDIPWVTATSFNTTGALQHATYDLYGNFGSYPGYFTYVSFGDTSGLSCALFTSDITIVDEYHLRMPVCAGWGTNQQIVLAFGPGYVQVPLSIGYMTFNSLPSLSISAPVGFPASTGGTLNIIGTSLAPLCSMYTEVVLTNPYFSSISITPGSYSSCTTTSFNVALPARAGGPTSCSSPYLFSVYVKWGWTDQFYVSQANVVCFY